MKVMIRRNAAGILSAYIAKKDLEEPIVEVEKPELWGGVVTLANGWQLELPEMDSATTLPITVEARRIAELEIQS
jgi:nitrogen fixation protein NifT